MWEYRSFDELYHHGILGQKWGQKNGPPYPIEQGRHSAAEKKAKAEAREKKREEKATARIEAAEKKAAEKEKNRLFTKKQKKILALGAVAVALAMRKYTRIKNDKKSEYNDLAEKFKSDTGLSDLTDEALKQKVNRLKLEKDFIELAGKNKTVEKGKDAVSTMLGTAGKEALKGAFKAAATTALTGAFLYGLKAAASNSFDRKALGDAMFIGGGKKK